MTDAHQARRTGPALESFYRFLLWLNPTIEKFPRSQKFLLGDRLQSAALDTLDGLIEATYTRDCSRSLARVNLNLEKLRVLFRLALDLRHLDERRYEFAVRALDETGRLVGGWLKKSHGEATQAPV
ncbi:diversity-generating retroelement protein Avd [Methylolobus aquaticus]